MTRPAMGQVIYLPKRMERPRVLLEQSPPREAFASLARVVLFGVALLGAAALGALGGVALTIHLLH